MVCISGVLNPKRYRELEDIFIGWSNTLDDTLLSYLRNINDRTEPSLIKQREDCIGSILELEQLDREYKSLSAKNISHSNYEKARTRLKVLYTLVTQELMSRRSRGQETGAF